jgi:hypothetical protein
LSTISHLQHLLADIDALLGNNQGHQTTAQMNGTLAKTMATLQAQTSAFERAQTVERLQDALAVESLSRINDALMEDYPK